MLPSERSALVLLEQGPAAALPGIARNMVERTTLIAIGLVLAGLRKRVVWHAFMGALMVEAGVIAYVGSQGRGP